MLPAGCTGCWSGLTRARRGSRGAELLTTTLEAAGTPPRVVPREVAGLVVGAMRQHLRRGTAPGRRLALVQGSWLGGVVLLGLIAYGYLLELTYWSVAGGHTQPWALAATTALAIAAFATAARGWAGTAVVLAAAATVGDTAAWTTGGGWLGVLTDAALVVSPLLPIAACRPTPRPRLAWRWVVIAMALAVVGSVRTEAEIALWVLAALVLMLAAVVDVRAAVACSILGVEVTALFVLGMWRMYDVVAVGDALVMLAVALALALRALIPFRPRRHLVH